MRFIMRIPCMNSKEFVEAVRKECTKITIEGEEKKAKMELTEDKLKELYVEKALTLKLMAKETGYSVSYLKTVLAKYGISKPAGGAGKKPRNGRRLFSPEEEIRAVEMYIIKNKTAKEIAEEFDLKEKQISSWFAKHNIRKKEK